MRYASGLGLAMILWGAGLPCTESAPTVLLSSNNPQIAHGYALTSNDPLQGPFIFDFAPSVPEPLFYSLYTATEGRGTVPCSDPPYTPSSPGPADNSLDIPVTNVLLEWTGGSPYPGEIVSYDIYFGTSNPPSLHTSGWYQERFQVNRTLANGTTYFWKIAAFDSCPNTTEGPVWQFQTVSEPTPTPSPTETPTPSPTPPTTRILAAGYLDTSLQARRRGDFSFVALVDSAGGTVEILSLGTPLGVYLTPETPDSTLYSLSALVTPGQRARMLLELEPSGAPYSFRRWPYLGVEP